jgi:hypothetical protein
LRLLRTEDASRSTHEQCLVVVVVIGRLDDAWAALAHKVVVDAVILEAQFHGESILAFSGEISIRDLVESALPRPSAQRLTEERVANGIQEARLASHVLAVHDDDTRFLRELQKLGSSERPESLNLKPS